MAGPTSIPAAKGSQYPTLFSASRQADHERQGRLVLLLSVTLFVSLCVAPLCVAEEGANHDEEYYYQDVVVLSEPARAACNGTIGECNLEEAETVMDSEINRRLLAAGKQYNNFIAYRVIVADSRANGGGTISKYSNGKIYGDRCREDLKCVGDQKDL